MSLVCIGVSCVIFLGHPLSWLFEVAEAGWYIQSCIHQVVHNYCAVLVSSDLGVCWLCVATR